MKDKILKIHFLTLLLLLGGLPFVTSCSSDDDSGIIDDEETNNSGGSSSTATAKPRYVWIDAGGNFEDYANSQENIKADLQKVKDAGFTEIVVDVRPTLGDVLFKSSVADPLQKMDVWSSAGYVWVVRTATFDYLQAFIDEGHKLGLKVNASINTFVGGYLCPYGLGSTGMLYRDGDKKEWATVINHANGLKNTMDLTDATTDSGARFLNPANDEVQEFLLQLLTDLAKYDVDGIVLDRCRYDDYGLMSDFSEESRTKFERYIGETIANWPSDVMAPGTKSLPATPSKYFKLWLEFRAKTIHDFIVKAAEKVKSVNSDVRFGAYVGAWYSTYYEAGVNWASPKYNTAVDYPNWASSSYKNYGYADHCDFMFLGAYASTEKIYGTTEWTMQGFCQRGRNLLKDDTEFAGGPDIGNSTGWVDGGQSAKIPDAIDACINASDGFFVFDLCHIKMHNYWDAFKQGFDKYLKSIE
ncbi:MAG: family 10 glycosylhydrolase [Bacteroides sp.]|nr:family 10 glycosylhydrolase [Bacteroides sp.]